MQMQNNEDLSFSLNSNHILNSNIEQASPSVFHNYDYHAQNTRPKLQKSNPNPKKSKAGKLSKTMQNRYFSEDDDKENNTSYFNSTPHEEIKPGPYVEKNTEVTQFNLEEPSIKLQNGTELFLDEDGLLTPKSPSSPKESKIDISQYIQEGEESHVEALKKREDLIRNIEKTPDYRNCSEMDLTSADVSDLFEAGELSKRNVYKHQEKVKIVEKPEYSQSPQQPYFNQKMENSSNDKKEKLNPPNESGNINLNPNENLLKSFSIKISTSNLAETHKNIMGSLDYSKSNIEESKNFIGKSSQLFFEPNPEVEKIKSALLNMEELQKIRNEALSEITKKKEKENTDFLVKEFLKNNQPKTVESVHESRENSAGKDLDNDSLLNGRASFGTFNNKENSQKKSGNEFTPRISQEGQGGRNFEERIGTQLKKKFSEGYKQSEEIDFTKTPNTSHLSVYSDKTNGGGGVFTQTSDSKNFNILSKDPFLDFNSPPNLRITNKNFIDTEERQTAKFEKFQRENSGMNRIVEESEDSSVVGEIGKEQNKHHLVSFNQSQMPSPDKSIERKIDQEEEKLGEEKSLDEEEVTPSPGKQEKSEKKIKGINEKIYTEFGTQTFDTCFEEKETSQKKQQQQQEINTSQRRLPPKIRHNIQSDKTLIFHSHEEQIESLKALVSNKPQNQQRSSQKSNASQKSFMQNSFSNQNYSISTNINQHYSSQNSTSPYFGTPNNQIMQMNNYRLSSKSHNSACNSNSDRKSIGLPANKFSQGKNNFFNRLNNMSVYNASYQSNMLNSTLNSSMMHNLNFNSNRALSKIFTNYNNNEVDFYSSFDRRGSSSISLMPRHLKNIGPDCFENSKFTYLAKECYLYSFMSSRLNQSGLEMIQIGIKDYETTFNGQVENLGDYVEQRDEAIENVMEKETELLAAKHLLLAQKIEKILVKLNENSTEDINLSTSKSPTQKNCILDQTTLNKLLTRRLKKLINEKEDFECKDMSLCPQKIQLLKVDETSHVAEAFRETDSLVSKNQLERLKNEGNKQKINPNFLEMKKRFVKIYLNLKEKIPIAKEMHASVHEIWSLIEKNRVVEANWVKFIQMFITDRKRKKRINLRV